MRISIALAQVLCLITAPFVQAQDAAPQNAGPADGTPSGARIEVQLNSAKPSDGGCRLSFLASSTHQIDKLIFEAVLFTTAGEVERLTLFDLQELPAGRARVRQFDVQGLSCDQLGQVLINGLQSCTGPQLDTDLCLSGLAVTSRVDGVELAG